ncbi:MAG: DNA-binding protein [Gammaproteobacteria bacterium]
MPPSKFALSLAEFAESHSLSRTTVYKEIAAGRLKVSKVGRRTLVTLEQAADWRASVSGAGAGARAA